MIALASDHAGFAYKEKIKSLLNELGLKYEDFGTFSADSVDYPDFAHNASEKISDGSCDRGIFVCGTGIGVGIVANKHTGIRAANCQTPEAARLARLHNNANVLTLGGRLVSWDEAVTIIKTFLETPFEGGRHTKRIDKIHTLTGL